MRKAIVLALILLGFCLLCFVSYKNMVIEIGPHEVGVRTQNFSILGTKGLHKKDYDEPGSYRNIPFLDDWYVFNKTVQTLSFKEESSSAITILTADGYRAQVCLDVKFRIKEGEAYQLLQKMGPGNAYITKIENETLDKARIVLGTMNSDDFEKSSVLKSKSQLICKKLRIICEPRHIDVVELEITGASID